MTSLSEREIKAVAKDIAEQIAEAAGTLNNIIGKTRDIPGRMDKDVTHMILETICREIYPSCEKLKMIANHHAVYFNTLPDDDPGDPGECVSILDANQLKNHRYCFPEIGIAITDKGVELLNNQEDES